MDPDRSRSHTAAPRSRGPVTAACLLLLPLGALACGGGDGGEAGGAGQPEAGGPDEPEAAAEADAAAQREGPELTEVNRFLSYSAADSLVDLKIWAGWGGANSAWNFDGYYSGNATIVVPAGWRVEATYRTLDANVPHSAAVVRTLEELPQSGAEVELAFPGASTPSFTTGLSSTHKPVEFAFKADEAGRYWLLCGVPGHATAGMWIWFEVVEGADAPDFRVEEGGG